MNNLLSLETVMFVTLDFVVIVLFIVKISFLNLSLNESRNLNGPYLFAYFCSNFIPKFKLSYLGKFGFTSWHFNGEILQHDKF